MRGQMSDRYAWFPRYNTGNDMIDVEHKKIFEAANIFHKAYVAKLEHKVIYKLFDFIINYTNTHFANEEKFFREMGCRVLNEHDLLHRKLVNEIREMWHEKRTGINENIEAELDYWIERRLIPHILEDDLKALKSLRRL
jgi:hemerythrin